MSRLSVTFDLWETLLLDEPEIEHRRIELRCEQLFATLTKMSIKVALDGLRRAHEESSPWLMKTWKTNKEVSTLEHVKHIVKDALGVEPQLSQKMWGMLEEVYGSTVLSAPPPLNPDALQTLRLLRDRGIQIGLICNTGRSPGRTLRQLLDRFGIGQFFKVGVFSDEFGWRKPDPRIFLEASRQLGVPAANVVHVGDNPEDDVRGAKQAGMRAFLFDRKVPEGFENNPGSLYALTRRATNASKVEPDRTVKSLSEIPGLLQAESQEPG